MRQLSKKWPTLLTIIGFSQPAFYLLFRIYKPEILNVREFVSKLLGAAFIALIVWAFYGLLCIAARKPECPKCGSKSIAKYIYGFIRVTRSIERDFEEGKIVLAGCKKAKDSPIWFCNDCQYSWNKLPKKAKEEEKAEIIDETKETEQIDISDKKITNDNIEESLVKEPITVTEVFDVNEETIATSKKYSTLNSEKQPVMLRQIEKCANCERTIGKLEHSFNFKGNIVCTQCEKLLTQEE